MNSQINIENNHGLNTLPTLISAARTLYQSHLKAGCEQLLNLNRILLKAERKQRMRQTLYRLGWVFGLSVLVLVLSYLTVGVNFVTAIGLLVAYFVGLIMHSKYSPQPAKHKEEYELLELNNELRREIVAVESEHGNVLCALLEATDLMQLAKKNGFTLDCGNPAAEGDKVLIDDYQVDGNGLYQYIDAMNLLMEKEDKLDAL